MNPRGGAPGSGAAPQAGMPGIRDRARRPAWIACPLATLAFLLAAPPPAIAAPALESVQTRLDIGHDSNLLDASDGERAAFESHDPRSFFVVSAMHDEFLEGALAARWQLEGRARTRLEARFERRQYLYNPIRSVEIFGLEGRVRAARGSGRIRWEGIFPDPDQQRFVPCCAELDDQDG